MGRLAQGVGEPVWHLWPLSSEFHTTATPPTRVDCAPRSVAGGGVRLLNLRARRSAGDHRLQEATIQRPPLRRVWTDRLDAESRPTPEHVGEVTELPRPSSAPPDLPDELSVAIEPPHRHMPAI